MQPILETYCYGCHGNGAAEGNRTLDEFASDARRWKISTCGGPCSRTCGLASCRRRAKRVAERGRRRALDWIKFDVFGIDPQNPDPGRATLRRLNRTEYRNTIRDLMESTNNTAEFFRRTTRVMGSTTLAMC